MLWKVTTGVDGACTAEKQVTIQIYKLHVQTSIIYCISVCFKICVEKGSKMGGSTLLNMLDFNCQGWCKHRVCEYKWFSRFIASCCRGLSCYQKLSENSDPVNSLIFSQPLHFLCAWKHWRVELNFVWQAKLNRKHCAVWQPLKCLKNSLNGFCSLHVVSSVKGTVLAK